MDSKYPNELPGTNDWITYRNRWAAIPGDIQDGVSLATGSFHNRSKAEIIAIANALGTNPHGTHGTVGNRFSVIEASVTNIINQLDGVLNDLTIVRDRLDGIDSSISGIDGRLGGIDDSLGSINGRLDGIDSSIYTIDGRLDSIEERLSVYEMLENVYERLDDIDAKIVTIEADIVTLIAFMNSEIDKYPPQAMIDGDSILHVSDNINYYSANTIPTHIINAVGGYSGQTIRIFIQDDNTYVNFSSGNIVCNAGMDWIPASGDFMVCTLLGSEWYCSIHLSY